MASFTLATGHEDAPVREHLRAEKSWAEPIREGGRAFTIGVRIIAVTCLTVVVACAHSPSARSPSLPLTRAIPTAPAIADVPETFDYPLAPYQPAWPEPSAPKVYVTMTVNEGPGSLERAAIEHAAQPCFRDALSPGRTAIVTMTLDTRADGTTAGVSVEGATPSLGLCLTQGLARIPLHEEGTTQHVVVILDASVSVS